ncbi:hypothetical protein WAX46_08745 [Bacillus sp. FJAT-53060]|uniref:hypothetical protein n=1 Tax=Bacillus TaxID=1386 RepID=UPI001CF99195|nr:hypothetical protein [Bacillus stratosphericus]
MFKSIFFRRKVSFISYENDDVSKLSAPNQGNVCLKDELFHALLYSAVGDASSVERRFTYVEVADLIRVDIAEFLCVSAYYSSVRAKMKTVKRREPS